MSLAASSNLTERVDLDNVVGLRLLAPDRIGATISARSRFNPISAVRIRCDLADWATVPVTPRQDGEPGLSFSCQLPFVGSERQVRVEARNAQTNELLGNKLVRLTPVRSAAGLPAHRVLDAVHGPLCSMLGLSFDGVTLTVSGAQLPPNGDPSQLKVEFGPGVSFTVDYPLPSPDFGRHYWYWPNADRSGLRININLPACAPGADPFSFRLIYPALDTLSGAARQKQARDALVPSERTIYLPSSLHSFIGFPGNISQLTRVQAHDTVQSVTFTGYNVFRTLEEILTRHGLRRGPDTAVLDWGCGHGRVTRHFIQNWPEARICGVDIDAENAAWCNENLPGGRFFAVPLWPPTDLDDASFDAVFGISVMTHLTEEAQDAWLRELSRILKPGGLALLTFAGPGAVAFSSIWRDEAWWDGWLANGFDDTQPDPALADKIADPTYYRNSFQMSDHVRRTYGRHLDVVAIELEQFGYQDLVVLRRPT